MLTGKFGSGDVIGDTFGGARTNFAQSVSEAVTMLEKGTPADEANLAAGLGTVINTTRDLGRALGDVPIQPPELMTQALLKDLGLEGKLSKEQVETIAKSIVEQNVKTAQAVEALSEKIDSLSVGEFMKAAVEDLIAGTKTLLALKTALQKP